MRERLAVAVVLAIYAGLLVFEYNSVPGPVFNDTAVEALNGYEAVHQQSWKPISDEHGGGGQEMLYLSLTGLSIHALGFTRLAILLPSWICALATLWLLYEFGRRHRELVDPVTLVVIAVGCLWLFHFARNGVRTISSPVILLGFLLSLRRRPGLCGLMMGLGLYCYTSLRILPVIFVADAIASRKKQGVWKTLGIFALIATPLLLYGMQHPATVFARGSYVVRGGPLDWLVHIVHSIILPVHLPERYTVGFTDTHFLDPIATTLPTAGLSPIPAMLGVAVLFGAGVAWKYHRREPVVQVLLWSYALMTVLLGFTGPSLSRLLLALPIYVILAGMGLRFGMEKFRLPVLAVQVAVLLVTCHQLNRYFIKMADSENLFWGTAATPMGQTAAELARSGRRVLCLITRDGNVIQYFTFDQQLRVHIWEFYQREFNPDEIALEEWKADVILVQRDKIFFDLVKKMVVTDHRRYREHVRFVEIWNLP